MVQLFGNSLACGLAALALAVMACGDGGRVTQGRAPATAGEDAAAATQPAAPQPVAPAKPSPAAGLAIWDLEFEPESPTVLTQRLRVVAETRGMRSPSLECEWQVDRQPVGSSGDTISLSGLEKGQLIEVSVVAKSAGKRSDPAQLSTRIANAPPTVSRLDRSSDDPIVTNSSVSVIAKGRDADGDDISFQYEWSVNGKVVRERSRTLKTRRVRRGQRIQVAVVAFDGESKSEAFVSPEWTVVNSPPKIVSSPGAPSSDGAFRYQLLAEDPDGDQLFEYRVENAPAGMRLDESSGTLTWSPSEDQVGSFRVTMFVSDGKGGTTGQQLEINVGDAGGDESPAAAAP